MPLVLGVDGGNSKAIALVAQADGTIVGAARCLGSADIYARGPEPAVETVATAVADALASAGSRPPDLGASIFSMAGADWPEDFDLLRAALANRAVADRPVVVNDAIGALFGAVPHGTAVVVSLGTGAATGARGSDGRTWHSSFWQSPQGAADLAQRAVAAIVQADLGNVRATQLTRELQAATGDATTEEVLHRFTRRGGVATAEVAAVVAAVLRAAAAEDAIASELVRSHGTGIGQLAAGAARRVAIDDEPYRLSFCGGLVRAGAGILVEAAIGAVREAGQRPTVVGPRWEPAIGALVIGLVTGSEGLRPEVAANLDATAPGADLFDVLGGPGT